MVRVPQGVERTATLFPYSTLFRSRGRNAVRPVARVVARRRTGWPAGARCAGGPTTGTWVWSEVPRSSPSSLRLLRSGPSAHQFEDMGDDHLEPEIGRAHV